MRSAVLAGLGVHLPGRVVTNAELTRRLDTSDEWIRQRTGIRERRFVAPGETTADLAVRAGEAALRSAEVDSAEAVIVATCTPDRPNPATAPEVAARLGLPQAAAFDLNAMCTGFVYALACAGGLITAGTADRVLVIGADTFSTILDPADRGTSVIFGDGAGAVLLRAGSPGEPGALGPFDLGSDGTRRDLIQVPSDPPYLRMDGKNTYRNAVSRMTRSAQTVLRRADWSVDEVDCLVAHQANSRILASVALRLGLPAERCVVNLDRLGNTVAASIPLALADALRTGLLSAKDRVLLTAFGGGLTWGSTVLTWPNIEIAE